MSNKSKIQGDDNFVFQGNKNSKFDIQNKTKRIQSKPKYGLIGLIITIIGLIATIIIGWDSIINFFTK